MLLIAIALQAVATPPPAGEWKTKVEGSTFRVKADAKGGVEVVNKAVIAGRTMDVRDKMRAAVKQVTGCRITDELWFDAKLKGKLDCSGAPPGA